MEHLADRLDAAAAELTTVQRALLDGAPPARAFGADGLGADGLGADGLGTPGELGRALHRRWAAVCAARAAEADAVASRLAELSAAVRSTRREYDHADDLARRRVQRGR